MSHRKRYRQYDNDDGRERKRVAPDPMLIENRLESLITLAGEKSNSSLETNLEKLANALDRDMLDHKKRILQILCTCVTNLPEKATIYGTLVGLLNEMNFDFGKEFLDHMVSDLKEVLYHGQWNRARLMIRFLADLINCNFLVASSLITFLEALINEALEPEVPQVRSDWFIYSVLTSLPWCGKELYAKKPKEFSSLLASIKVYLSGRNKIHVKALRVWSSDQPHPQEEYLDCLWEQIKTMEKDGWNENHIRRPYNAFHSVLCKAMPHPIPVFHIPQHSDTVDYQLPAVIFRMFDYADAAESKPIPGAHAIERYLVEESVLNILSNHYKDRKECARQLMVCSEKNNIAIEYVIIEVIFGSVFRLPESPHLLLFYGSLIIELCKLASAVMPGVVAQGVELLFERLPFMNITCIDRFIDWFSYHLSNFQYKWTWEDWAQYADCTPDDQRARFITEVFSKCQRSTYQANLLDIIPSDLHSMIPEPPQGYFRYENLSDTGIPGYATVRSLINGIKANHVQSELLDILYKIPASEKSFYVNDELIAPYIDPSIAAFRIECFVLTILRAGLKSITHTYNALTKFHDMFVELITSKAEQIHALRVVKEFWWRNPLMVLVVVDKMVKLQYIQCSTVVNWIFSKEMEAEFMKYNTWELLHNILKKMTQHKTKAKKDLEEAHEKLDVLIDKAKKAEQAHRIDDDDSVKQVDIEEAQEKIEELTQRVEIAKKDQKELFLIVFQRFTMIVTEHITECEKERRTIANSWYRFTLQRLQEIFLLYLSEIDQYSDKMEKLIFTPDIPEHVLEVFRRYKSLRS